MDSNYNDKTNNDKTNNDKPNSDKMNIQIALDELDISLDEIELTKLDQAYIKKRYHKLALKWHPDKNKDHYATIKFQKISEAYDFLSRELNIINETNMDYSNTSEPFVSSYSSKESKIYMDILGTFISSVFDETKRGSYTDLLMNIIKEIVINYDVLTLTYLRKIFEDLDKQKAIEIYQLLYKYKDILYISRDILELVSLIVKEKYKNDRVFIVKPSLKDLLEHNIYKLYVDDDLYLVPLWHNELYFDSKDGTEIIVLCQPKLPDQLTIDENNNIYYETSIDMVSELPNLIKNTKFVSLELGEKWFSMPLDKLHLKEEQIYRFKGQGIARISEKDMYTISDKGDIIVKLMLI